MKKKLSVRVQIVNDGEHKESAVFIIDENKNATDELIVVSEAQLKLLTERIENLKKTCVLKNDFSKEIQENLLKEGASTIGQMGERYAPFEHSSSDGKYGVATASKYGHVKFINTMAEYEANKESKDHAISVNLLEQLLEKYKKGE